MLLYHPSCVHTFVVSMGILRSPVLPTSLFRVTSQRTTRSFLMALTCNVSIMKCRPCQNFKMTNAIFCLWDVLSVVKVQSICCVQSPLFVNVIQTRVSSL